MSAILIAGGGTGGHVFPALAVAHALRALAEVQVVFAGSPRGLEARVVPEQGYELELLDVEPMKGGGTSRAVRGALVAARAMRRAVGLVRKLRPVAALSVGGYAAGPAALACVSQRVPLAVLEPNNILGLANRLLAPFSRRAYVAWPETTRHFRSGCARVYGVPLRSGFEPHPYAVPAGEERRVLVLGGSQGAQPLNERLPAAFARAVGSNAARVRIIHQSGRDRDAAVREEYARLGLTNVEVTPFLDRIADQMIAADLIVARSGAATVAEICAIGRAAIFVPFPHAADDHQAKNALALSERGGAVCVRQEAATEERLATELGALLFDDPRRVAMANVALEHGRPNAAGDIARDLLELGGISPRITTYAKKVNGVASSTVRTPSREVS